MDGLVGIAIAVAILVFIVWLIGKIISIALFVVIVIPIYIVLAIYAGIKFIGMSTFIAMDKLFYLGFDIPVIAVWIFWGLVIGAAIQGCREMKIYGRKRTGVLIAITPVLLLAFVGAVKIKKAPLVDAQITTALAPSGTSIPENMVLIPAGKFQMGSSKGESRERPVHTVFVDAFYMDTYEVTNAEYVDFLNTKGKHAADGTAQFYPTAMSESLPDGVSHSQIQYLDERYSVKPGYENHPVGSVTWSDAMAYAAWVGKRLPTEAEWEKAARGGLVGMAYPWGNSINNRKANYNEVPGKTLPVGQYPANTYGLYDMAGNVWEWCLDEYDTGFYANSPEQNPIAGGSIPSIIENFTDIKTIRVLRGGSSFDVSENVRCASRFYGHPSTQHALLGFRCVRSIPPERQD